MATPSQRNGEARGKLVEAVSAPLGFYVLSLLIVEAFLASVLLGPSGLAATDKVTLAYVGVGLFVLVFVAVSVLVWFKATNLTFGAKEHLQATRPLDTPAPIQGMRRVKKKPSVISQTNEGTKNDDATN